MADRQLVIQFFEDDPDIRTIVEIALGLSGIFKVYAAAPEADFLESIRQLQPDLVLLDVMMPGVNGIDIATALRADPQLSEQKFAFITARAMPHELEQLRSLGACGIISKPFDPLRLADELRTLLNANS